MASTQTTDASGNVVVNGFSTNLSPMQFASSNIPVSNIAPTTPVNIPTPQQDTSIYTTPITGVQADINGALTSAKNQVDQATSASDGARNQGLSLASLISGAEASNVKDVAGTYNAQGVNDLYNKLSDLQAQSVGLQNEASAIPIQEQQRVAGQGVTDRGLAPITTARLRDNALKALSLGQQYAIASGNYEKAKNYADQLIDTKFSADTARINALKTQQTALEKYVLTPAETARLDAVKRKTDLEAKQLDQKIADAKEVSKLIVDASQFAPADVLQRARDVQSKGGNASEVAMALGPYGADYLKNLAYRSQLETDKAQRANIYSQIAERNKIAISEQQLSNFVTPPTVNPETGKADPSGQLTSVIKALGGKADDKLKSTSAVISAAQRFAENNASKKDIKGFGPFSIQGGPFIGKDAQRNVSDIAFLELNLQSWATGASVAADQMEKINKLIPKPNDTDRVVKNKINAITNYMQTYAKGNLNAQGIPYNPSEVDLFGGISSASNEALLNSIPSAPTTTTATVDNKSFFNR